MSCANSSGTEYSRIINTLKECIIEVKMDITRYKIIHKSCNKKSHQDIVKSIIIDKDSHLKILKEIFKLATGEDLHEKVLEEKTITSDTSNLIKLSIEKEFQFVILLKNLRFILPEPSVKQAINAILIDQNLTINKLIYMNI
ncbi:hypothetical protein [Clostridium cylindrosporum]|uniref:Rubrerythrin diiron-binding domain-containing protein n=1 Tax=Clostridium cylindrosporum DSM 605 TaxID=1121307 RepID=A0A0J8DGJ6_CLOCY|nr:hypothetical protein [Clostridium cylindrosporum]KMT23298.1 hypothetical protein CLCY_8c00340 [Clostridium cylindrosporum DSM 605]